MTTGIDRTNGHAAAAELALISGDLGKLTPEARLDYYQRVCQSTGLNPWTQPFSYIVLNNKLTLYCRKDATDQLRKIHQVSVTITSRERIDDVYVVTARATLPDGRTDESIGAVTLGSLKGDGLANALMKAESKAKRRVTLSICGLGMLDETEVESVRVLEQQVVEPAAPRLQAAPSGSGGGSGGGSGASGQRLDFSSFWKAVREAGWDAETIQAAGMQAFAKPVANLTAPQLAELRDAALSARLVADGEGVWRIQPIGEDVAEVPAAEV